MNIKEAERIARMVVYIKQALHVKMEELKTGTIRITDPYTRYVYNVRPSGWIVRTVGNPNGQGTVINRRTFKYGYPWFAWVKPTTTAEGLQHVATRIVMDQAKFKAEKEINFINETMGAM